MNLICSHQQIQQWDNDGPSSLCAKPGRQRRRGRAREDQHQMRDGMRIGEGGDKSR